MIIQSSQKSLIYGSEITPTFTRQDIVKFKPCRGPNTSYSYDGYYLYNSSEARRIRLPEYITHMACMEQSCLMLGESRNLYIVDQSQFATDSGVRVVNIDHTIIAIGQMSSSILPILLSEDGNLYCAFKLTREGKLKLEHVDSVGCMSYLECNITGFRDYYGHITFVVWTHNEVAWRDRYGNLITQDVSPEVIVSCTMRNQFSPVVLLSNGDVLDLDVPERSKFNTDLVDLTVVYSSWEGAIYGIKANGNMRFISGKRSYVTDTLTNAVMGNCDKLRPRPRVKVSC